MSGSHPPMPPDQGGEDPWAAFGYLVAGVLFYGLVGWGLSSWLHAGYWIPIGILVGAAFGMYLAFARYRVHAPPIENRPTNTPHDVAQHDEAARDMRPDSDDRGETA